jgi:hypothetical protein
MGRQSLLAICLAALLANASHAAISFSDTANPGVTYATGAVTDYNIYGDMMDGMKVTATFSGDPNPHVAFWQDINTAPSVRSGGASDSGFFSLTEEGHTYGTIGHAWTLTVYYPNVLTHLTIEGVFATQPTVFDVSNMGSLVAGPLTPGPSSGSTGAETGTGGSAKGWTFELPFLASYNAFVPPISSLYTYDITATYSNLVGVGGNPPDGDVFTTLDLDFTGGPFGGMPGGNSDDSFPITQTQIVFYADTDQVDRLDTAEPTPEPSSAVIFAGLALTGGWWLRKRSPLPRK